MSSDQASPMFKPASQRPRVNFHSIADLISPTEPDNQSSTPRTPSPGARNAGELPVTPDMTSPGFGANLMMTSPSTTTVTSPIEVSVITTTPEDSVGGKKGRTIYKAQQVYVLEQVFHRTHYPDPEVIETLSRDLEIAENKIKVWFQNKRARWRRRVQDNPNSASSSSSTGMTTSSNTPPPPSPACATSLPHWAAAAAHGLPAHALYQLSGHHYPSTTATAAAYPKPDSLITIATSPFSLATRPGPGGHFAFQSPIGTMDSRAILSPEYGQHTSASLVQLRKAAHLHSSLGFPSVM